MHYFCNNHNTDTGTVLYAPCHPDVTTLQKQLSEDGVPGRARSVHAEETRGVIIVLQSPDVACRPWGHVSSAPAYNTASLSES